MTRLRILVLGATGQVGKAFVSLDTEYEIFGLDRSEGDITAPGKIEDLLDKVKPNWVVNAAAYTRVDDCESNIEHAFLVNAMAVGSIARACESRSIALVHYSTDYVFDGEKSEAYSEEDNACPVNIYGCSKYYGEVLARRFCSRTVIFRVSWVFSSSGRNFVKSMLELGQKTSSLRIVSDQIGCPISANTVADTSLQVIRYLDTHEFRCPVVLNLASKTPTAWSNFARRIFAHAITYDARYQDISVEDIASKDYPTAALRPLNSVLSTKKIEQIVGLPLPDWDIQLSNCITKIIDQA